MNVPVLIGIVVTAAGALLLGAVMYAARAAGRRREQRAGSEEPLIPVSLASVNDAVIAARLGGQVTFANDRAREWFGLHDEEPHLWLLTRDLEEPEAFLELFAAEGQTSFALGERQVDASSHRVMIGGEAHLVVVLRERAPLPVLDRSERGTGRAAQVVGEIARSIHASRELQPALRATLQSAQRLIDFDAAQAYLWDAEREVLRLVARLDDGGYEVIGPEAATTYRRDQGYPGWVARRRQPLLIHDTRSTDKLARTGPLDDPRVSSYLGAPLLVGNRLVGLLDVTGYRPNEFDAEDEAVLMLLAEQAAIAIDNAQVYSTQAGRVAELAGLQRVAESISVLQDPRRLFAQLGQRVAELMGTEMAGVLLYDREGQRLVAQRPFHGMLDTVAARYVIPLERGSPARGVWEDMAYWFTNDAASDLLVRDLGLAGIAELAGARTVALAAMSVGDERSGVLQVSNKVDGSPFTMDDIRLLQAYASQAAVVVESARLYAQEQSRVAELQGLQQIVQALSAFTNPEELYAQLTQRIADLLGVSVCGILLYEPHDEQLTARTPFFGVDDDLARRLAIPVRRGFAREVWREHELYLSNRVPTDETIDLMGLRELAHEAGLQTVMLAPLSAGGRRFGLLQVGNKVNGAEFEEGDERLVKIFAGQAAALIENARLYQDTETTMRRRAAELRAVARVSHELNATLELERILRAISLQAQQAEGARWSRLVMFRPERVFGEDLGEAARSLEQTCAQAGRILRIDDFERQGEVAAPLEGARSALLVPIDFEGEVVGVISLYADRPRALGASALEFVQALASQATSAVTNARRHAEQVERAEALSNSLRDLERSYAELDKLSQEMIRKDVELSQANELLNVRAARLLALHRVMEGVDTTQRPDDVLAGIARSVVEEMDVEQCLIALPGEDDASELRLVAAVGPLPDGIDLARLAREEALLGEIVERREAVVYAPGGRGGSGPARLASALGATTFVALPMPLASGGLMIIGSTQPGSSFGDEDRDLFALLASQTVAEYENAHLYSAVQREAAAAAADRDRLQQLHLVTTALQQSRHLEERLAVIARGLHSVGWGKVAVMLLDRDQAISDIATAGYTAEEQARLRESLLPGETWAHRYDDPDLMSLALGSGFFLPAGHPWVLKHVPGMERSRAASDPGRWHPDDQFYLPMYAGTQIIGVIHLREPANGRRPTVASLRPIELFMQQAASALENTRLYQETVALQSYNEAVVQSIQQGIVVTDARGAVETINSFVREAYGWDDSLLGETLAGEGTPLSELGLAGDVAQVLAHGEPVQRTGVTYAAGGETRHLNIYVYPRYDDVQAVNGTVIMLEDVSQRARLEADIALRGRQLAALNEVSRHLTAALDVNDVVRTALDEAGAVVKLDQVALWLRSDEQAGHIRLAGLRGNADGLRVGALLDLATVPAFAHILETGAPLIPDAPSAASAAGGEDAPRSWMGVPMISGGEATGIMVFGKREAHAYAPADGQVAAALANQTAVALQNARLFEEARDRAEALHSRSQRLALLNRISSTLGSSLDQNSILQTAIDELVHALDADQGGVIIFDDVHALGRLEIQSPSNPDGSVEKLVISLNNNPAIDQLLQARAPIAIEDVASDPRAERLRKPLEARSVKSTLLIPLMLGNTFIGLMTVDATRERRRFEPEQIELAQTITNQVAISVQNAQLFGETVARQRELGILSEAGRVLATSLDLNTVAERAADYFMRSLNTAGCAISLLDDSGELLTLSEVTRQPLAGAADERGDLLKLPAVRRVIAEREGMHIRAVTTELGSSQASWMRRRGITSMLMLPLLSHGEVIGLVELWHRQTIRLFDDREARLARALAATIATALENARLHQQTEERLVELAALNETSRALTQVLSLDDLYDLLPRQLERVFGVRSLTLALREPATGQLAVPLDVRDGRREPAPADAAGMAVYAAVLEGGDPLLVSRNASERLAELGYEQPEAGLRSFLAVPFSSGTISGVLAAKDFERDDAFTEASLRVLSPLATQLAVSIENARLYAELEQRLSETTTLQEVSRVVNSALDLQQIFERVVRELASAFGYPLVGLYTLDGDSLVLEACHEHGSAPAAHRERVALGRSIVGRAASTAGAIFLRDVSEDTDYLPSRAWAHSEIAVPIIAEEAVLGVLSVAAGQDDPLTDNDLTLMQTFAAQVATAMSNAGLYAQMVSLSEELERRVEERTRELREERDRIDTLYRIAVELTASLDLDIVLSRAMALVGEAVGADDGVLFLTDLESEQLTQRASLHPETPLPPGGQQVALRRDEGLAGWVLGNRQSMLVADLASDPRWEPIPGAGEPCSLIGAPLIANDVVLGCMFFTSEAAGAFDEGHLRLVEAAANQVAGSINNAELYRMIREQAERLGVMLRTQQTEAAKSQAILESVADGVMVTDQSGRIILFNAAAERILGLRRGAALGQPASELGVLVGIGAERWAATLDAWRENPRLFDTSVFADQIEVQERVVSVHISPVLHNQDVLGLVSLFRDITREVEADRIKSEFVARVSHELRTPMTSIKGYADLLLMGAAGEVSADQRRFLDTIKANADRLSLLVNDLLDISRIEQGHVDLDVQPVDMAELVEGVVDSLRGRMVQEQRTLSVNCEVAADVRPVEADAARLTQVLTNLVNNAYQYTPDGGQIAIRVRSEDGGAQIDVADTGIGIAAEDRERIFERFYRGESNPIVFGTAGTGLGLSIVQQIVEMHHGRVSVESEEGAGSTFSVWLPYVFEGAVPQAPYL